MTSESNAYLDVKSLSLSMKTLDVVSSLPKFIEVYSEFSRKG